MTESLLDAIQANPHDVTVDFTEDCTIIAIGESEWRFDSSRDHVDKVSVLESEGESVRELGYVSEKLQIRATDFDVSQTDRDKMASKWHDADKRTGVRLHEARVTGSKRGLASTVNVAPKRKAPPSINPSANNEIFAPRVKEPALEQVIVHTLALEPTTVQSLRKTCANATEPEILRVLKKVAKPSAQGKFTLMPESLKLVDVENWDRYSAAERDKVRKFVRKGTAADPDTGHIFTPWERDLIFSLQSQSKPKDAPEIVSAPKQREMTDIFKQKYAVYLKLDAALTKNKEDFELLRQEFETDRNDRNKMIQIKKLYDERSQEMEGLYKSWLMLHDELKSIKEQLRIFAGQYNKTHTNGSSNANGSAKSS
eukprot:CAMPEP_0114546850 /NCGR_PEP_ID=MMETSP0114-20121206/4152_1 /TAXON_ID=31324 /ORGANISM="Goniomonas sp, Strain m" /LENGTH=368 /DNA_ID=CAMNT_0001731369 /DNA_START=61 /DNA_END=1167 /DNA_ORIENTATION=+